MLTISQLAAYAGVTTRAVRHYHHIGLLPEPERDASGYRRYGATAVVSLIKIRTLANAGVPLSQVAELLRADAAAFAEAVRRIDDQLRDEVERLETSRKQIAQLAAGDSLFVPPEVACYLDRLRQIGASERIVEGERDGVDPARGALARSDPRVDAGTNSRSSKTRDWSGSTGSCRRSFESDEGDDDPRLVEAADILADLLEQAYAAGQAQPDEWAHDDLPFDLLDALAVESDPRMERMQELMRERGWAGWTRLERLAERPDGSH